MYERCQRAHEPSLSLPIAEAESGLVVADAGPRACRCRLRRLGRVVGMSAALTRMHKQEAGQGRNVNVLREAEACLISAPSCTSR
jgi:hypothetical protein